MATHHHNHRRTIASTPTIDPTLKKHPKPTPISLNHPQPDPIPSLPQPHASTIQNISNRFSKLYSNHKIKTNKIQHPQPEPYFQGKSLSCPSPLVPPSSKSSSTSHILTKSSSLHERNPKTHFKSKPHYYFTTNTTKTKPLISTENEKPTKNPSLKEDDFEHVKKGLQKDEILKRSQVLEGGFVGEGGRRSSVSSMVVNDGVGGGRRRSFCNSQVELSDFLSCNGVKVVAVDMPPFMQIHAVDVARKVHDSLEKFTSKTLALTLKKEFDGVYGPAWHCIVGTSFGSFVTHSVGGFMYFSMDHKLYILLFKTTVQRATAAAPEQEPNS